MRSRLKNYFILITISTIFIAIFNICLSFIIQNIVDAIILKKSFKIIVYLFLMLIGVNILYPIVYCINKYLSKQLSLNSKEDAMKEIIKKQISSSLMISENVKDSEYIMILNEDLENYSNRWDGCYIPILKLTITMGVALFYGFVYSSLITIVVILLSLLYCYINNRIYSKVSIGKQKNSQDKSVTNQFIHDSIKNIEVLRVLRRINIIKEKSNHYINEERHSKNQYSKIETLSIILSEAPIQLIEVTILLIGVYLKIKGEISFGAVVGLWNGLIGSILWSTVEFPYFFKELSTVKNSKMRIRKFLDYKEEDYEIEIKTRKDKENLLNIENIKYRYNKNSKFLNYQNIVIPKIGITVIKGISGSGKSTFAKILSKLYKSDTDYLLNNKITYIPQEPEIFPLTIKENIVFDKPIKDDHISKTLEKLGFSTEFLKNRNLNSKISKENISKGEAYRLNLARLEYNDSDIVIMDEPFASLDEDNIFILIDLINKMAKTKSIIILTHIYTDVFKESNIYEIGVSL